MSSDTSSNNLNINLAHLEIPNSNFAFNLLVNYLKSLAKQRTLPHEDALKINECLNHFLMSQNNICINEAEFNTIVECQVIKAFKKMQVNAPLSSKAPVNEVIEEEEESVASPVADNSSDEDARMALV